MLHGIFKEDEILDFFVNSHKGNREIWNKFKNHKCEDIPEESLSSLTSGYQAKIEEIKLRIERTDLCGLHPALENVQGLSPKILNILSKIIFSEELFCLNQTLQFVQHVREVKELKKEKK